MAGGVKRRPFATPTCDQEHLYDVTRCGRVDPGNKLRALLYDVLLPGKTGAGKRRTGSVGLNKNKMYLLYNSS